MDKEQLIDDYLAITVKVAEIMPHIFKVVERDLLLSAFDNEKMDDIAEVLEKEIMKRTAVYELHTALKGEDGAA